jgi:hypothetical protein
MVTGERFTEQPGYETMFYTDEVKNRDPRLAQTVLCPGYIQKGGKSVTPNDMNSLTGYQPIKFIGPEAYDGASKGSTDLPIFRAAEVYLVYAEALAEHSTYTLTQNDLDISINKLRDRVGMPHLMLGVTADKYLTDPKYGYTNPILLADKDMAIILEIRRERAVELFKEGYRWDDLMRWKEGKCIEQDMLGIYFPQLGEYDLSGDRKADIVIYTGKKPAEKAGVAAYEVGVTTGIVLTGKESGYINPHPQSEAATSHVFDENRDYYYPIPSTERSLNPNLKQNPGWNDGLSEEGGETE